MSAGCVTDDISSHYHTLYILNLTNSVIKAHRCVIFIVWMSRECVTDDILSSQTLKLKYHEVYHQITHMCQIYCPNARRVRYRRHRIITYSLPTKSHELRISRTLSSNNTHVLALVQMPGGCVTDDILLSHILPTKSHEVRHQNFTNSITKAHTRVISIVWMSGGCVTDDIVLLHILPTKSHELRHQITGGCGANNDNDQHAAVWGWKGEWPNSEEQRLPRTLLTRAAAQASHCGNIHIHTYAYGKHINIHICIFAYMYMCERREGRFGRRKIVSPTLFAGAAAQASDCGIIYIHTYAYGKHVNVHICIYAHMYMCERRDSKISRRQIIFDSFGRCRCSSKWLW